MPSRSRSALSYCSRVSLRSGENATLVVEQSSDLSPPGVVLLPPPPDVRPVGGPPSVSALPGETTRTAREEHQGQRDERGAEQRHERMSASPGKTISPNLVLSPAARSSSLIYRRDLRFLVRPGVQFSVPVASFDTSGVVKSDEIWGSRTWVVDPRKTQSQAHLHHGASNASSQRSAARVPSRFRFNRGRRSRYVPR